MDIFRRIHQGCSDKIHTFTESLPLKRQKLCEGKNTEITRVKKTFPQPLPFKIPCVLKNAG